MEVSDFGPILTAVGTILVAYAIGKHKDNPGEYEDDNGRSFPEVYILRPRAFKFGLGLVVVGTVFQLSFFQKVFLRLF